MSSTCDEADIEVSQSDWEFEVNTQEDNSLIITKEDIEEQFQSSIENCELRLGIYSEEDGETLETTLWFDIVTFEDNELTFIKLDEYR